MDAGIIIQMIIAAVIGAAFYVILGVAPGTDETAVIAPVTLALVLAGINPMVVLCFFISSIVAKKITDSIPVSVAGIPGGVMSAPMVEHAVSLKSMGYADVSIRKMASGSVWGTIIAVPASLGLAYLLTPLADIVAQHAGLIFFIGALALALLSREKLISVLAVIPFGVLITSIRHFYWGVGAVAEDVTPFISFFLAITIGPMILNLGELAVGNIRKDLRRDKANVIELEKPATKKEFIPNPFKVLDVPENLSAAGGSLIGTVLFFMSPVGITILVGDVLSSRIVDPVKRSLRAISTMDGLTNALYISGTLVPLIALGIPLGPMAAGPANPLFIAPPVHDLDHNLHHILSYGEFALAAVIGAIIGLVIGYPLVIKYSRQICIFVFRRIPHEAFLAMFFALVMILAYMDASLAGLAGVLIVGILAGLLNRWGVNYGVQFMTLIAAPYIANTFFG